MNEGYSEIIPIMNRVKKRKIELEMLLAKHSQSHCTQKIMDLILKIEGLINKIKSLQMGVDVKGYTTNHSVPSGILHSKLLKELSQIKNEEQEIIEKENSLHALIANSSSIKEPPKKKMPKNTSSSKTKTKKQHDEDYEDYEEMEEFISHVKKPEKKEAEKGINTKSYYKPFKAPLTQLEKNRSLEVQKMVDQFRRIRNDLDSTLSGYQGQKYRKKIMDLIIKVKAHINLLLSLQSSFKTAEQNTINHSAKVNYSYLEDQLVVLGKEKKEILENQKILKAKIAREHREMIKQVYESKEINMNEEKDPGMVNLLLKLGLIKKKK